MRNALGNIVLDILQNAILVGPLVAFEILKNSDFR